MSRYAIAISLGLFLCPALTHRAIAQGALPAISAITEEQAHAIGVDAYVYLYPLITMDITRKQLTNADKGFGRGPMNVFHNVPAYPPAATSRLSARTTTRFTQSLISI